MTRIEICRNICDYNEHDFCKWCGRHLSEIARWPQMSDEEALERIESIKTRNINEPFDPQTSRPWTDGT